MSKSIDVKRFRAETMRDALTLVKEELGEEALVLETRRLTAGGFLGFGSKQLVEVAVAAGPAATAPKIGRTGKLSLTDSEPALPSLTSAEPTAARETSRLRRSTATFAALTSRAETSSVVPAPVRTFEPSIGVELAETAPRVVHNRTHVAPVNRAVVAPAAAAPAPVAAPAAGEMDRLRAELREMKFSLAALTTRPSRAESADSRAVLESDPELFDSPHYEMYLELTETGLPPALARRAVRAVEPSLLRSGRSISELAYAGLTAAIPSMMRFAEDPITLSPGTPGTPSAIALVGPTGVGKTTTIAKLAARVALKERRRVELVTLDTYRIAAVEQLRTYAEIIGAGCHVARTTLELDALLARFSGEAVVLVDTAGRSPNDLVDQIELADYLKAREDMLKCLVLQATTHPTDSWLAAKKFALYSPDWLVLTKLDETARPGAAIGVAADTGLPLVYLCSGQRVPEDIEIAAPAALARRAVRVAATATV